MSDMDAESVDLIFTDPPWLTTDLDFDKYQLPTNIYNYLKRALKPNGWFFCFGTIEMAAQIIQDWRLKFEYIWVKPRGTMQTHNTVHPMLQHELLFAFIKPELKMMNELYFDKQKLRTIGRSYTRKVNPTDTVGSFEGVNRRTPIGKDGKKYNYTQINNGYREGTTILEYPIKNCFPYKERTDHPTQKPLALCELIVDAYCPPDGTVYDPFAGSGTMLLAAEKRNRRWIGSEINPEYCKLIERRLDPYVNNKRLEVWTH